MESSSDFTLKRSYTENLTCMICMLFSVISHIDSKMRIRLEINRIAQGEMKYSFFFFLDNRIRMNRKVQCQLVLRVGERMAGSTTEPELSLTTITSPLYSQG